MRSCTGGVNDELCKVLPADGDVLLLAEGFVLKKGVASVQIDAKRVVARLEIVVNDHEKSSNVWPLTA